MPTVSITSVIGGGTFPGSQLAIQGNWTQLSQIKLTVRCKDDNGVWQTLTVAAVLTTTSTNPFSQGTFSALVSSPCGCGKDIQITAEGFDGAVKTAQDVFTGTLACLGNCCPAESDFSITVDANGHCTQDCTRLTSVLVDYSGAAKPDCPSTANVQMNVKDALGATLCSSFSNVTLGIAAQFGFSVALQAGATYTLELIVKFPGLSCPAILRTITVQQCDSPPDCPASLTLAGFDVGCAKVGDECLSTAQWVIGGDFGKGCGSQAATKLKLEYGDGSFEIITVPTAGSQQIVRTHSYSSGGTKTGKVTIVHPTGCAPNQVTAPVSLGTCAPDDCVSCDPPPEAPPWCLCKSCWLFSKKPGKGWCKPFMVLMLVIISSATLSVLHGWVLGATTVTWQNILAAVGTFGAIFFIDVYAKWCGKCCAACVIWPGVIIGIIASLIMWYYGYAPVGGPVSWIQRLIITLIAIGILYWIYNSYCAQEKEEELSPENWCK